MRWCWISDVMIAAACYNVLTTLSKQVRKEEINWPCWLSGSTYLTVSCDEKSKSGQTFTWRFFAKISAWKIQKIFQDTLFLQDGSLCAVDRLRPPKLDGASTPTRQICTSIVKDGPGHRLSPCFHEPLTDNDYSRSVRAGMLWHLRVPYNLAVGSYGYQY